MNDGTVLTLGVFDGLHIGHKKIMMEVVKEKKMRNLKSYVLSIKYPLNYFSNTFEGLIISTCMRRKKILELGIDLVEFLDIECIKEMKAHEFVEEYLVKRYNVSKIIVGHDFRFGKKREGDIETLKRCGWIYGFEVKVVNAVTLNGIRVSSSYIRNLIKNGDLVDVSHLLGEPLSMEGEIVALSSNKILVKRPAEKLVTPKHGYYEALVLVKDKWLDSLIGFDKTYQNNGKNSFFEILVNWDHSFNLHDIVHTKIIKLIGCDEHEKNEKFVLRRI